MTDTICMTKSLHPALKEILERHNLLNPGGEIDQRFPVEVLKAMDEINEHYVKSEISQGELEKLQAILDYTPCTISWIDNEYRYGGVNKALADVTGMDTSKFSGQSIGSVTGAGSFYEFAKSVFESEEETVYQELNGKISGEDHTFWTSGTKFDDNKQAIIIGVDVTELQHLRNTVEFQEKLSALGEMVAGIIHEVNNPLSVINLIAIALKKKFDDPALGPYIKDLEKTSKRISSIITGVKKFVRKGEGEPAVSTTIGNVLNDALSICEHKFKKQGIKFEFKSEELKDISLLCNETQIFQVFVNLFNNSVDAIEELPEKWVHLNIENSEDSEGSVRLIFTDSGKGIPKEVADRIFESFYTTKPAGKGTGLGLSLCKKILRSHGGDLHIDHTKENTTFIVELPKGSAQKQVA